jgi:hypothetical protein
MRLAELAPYGLISQYIRGGARSGWTISRTGGRRIIKRPFARVANCRSAAGWLASRLVGQGAARWASPYFGQDSHIIPLNSRGERAAVSGRNPCPKWLKPNRFAWVRPGPRHDTSPSKSRARYPRCGDFRARRDVIDLLAEQRVRHREKTLDPNLAH